MHNCAPFSVCIGQHLPANINIPGIFIDYVAAVFDI